MEKNKRWHFGLILLVLGITLYNILPTIFYYCKPLHHAIDETHGKKIIHEISARANQTSNDVDNWVLSYCKEINCSVTKIEKYRDCADITLVNFKSEADAEKFKNYFRRASITIDDHSSQISILESDDFKSVFVAKKLGIGKNLQNYLSFSSLKTDGALSEQYIKSRKSEIKHVIQALSQSENAQLLKEIISTKETDQRFPFLNHLAENISKNFSALSETPTALKRSLASITQENFESKSDAVKQALEGFEALKDKLKFEKVKLADEEKSLKENGNDLSVNKKEQLRYLESKEEGLFKTINIFKKNQAAISAGKKIVSDSIINSMVEELLPTSGDANKTVSLQGINPYIESISINWKTGKLKLIPYSDLKEEKATQKFSNINRVLVDEISKLSYKISHMISPSDGEFYLDFFSLDNPSSEILIDLKNLNSSLLSDAKKRIDYIFKPESNELKNSHENIKFISGLETDTLEKNSFYIVLKNGLKNIRNHNDETQNEDSAQYLTDLQNLQQILFSMDFYPVRVDTKCDEISEDDIVFEAKNLSLSLINATQENFLVSMNKEFAHLSMSTNKQRLHVINKIETESHNKLLKWKNDYFTALNHPYRDHQPLYVKPSKNTLISNLKLNFNKYFRGDERKVLKWGLDLSGGKSVEVCLFDHENQKVTAEKDIKLAINELYTRVNKLGVSEVAIRSEGDLITLDFPGSQELSAKDLIQSSSMTFNIVNEKFSNSNTALKDHVANFLQDVWNRALASKNFDVVNLNEIARDLLYGNSKSQTSAAPRTESAKILLESGLSFDKSYATNHASSLDFCKIYPLRQENAESQHLLQHPLLIVYAENALEGSNLSNIHSGYDPKEGNFLSFEVKKHVLDNKGENFSPQSHLGNWTEKFSQDAIKGTEKEIYTKGHGYRMAVILNGEIVTAPTLNAAIKENGRITGHFSQAEVYKLENDLKAGSLTFSPKILSERNVSPELGDQERFLGIVATLVALVLVIVTMSSYYRFAGVIASVAVIFNLIIMWAILQNIQAALTLAGLAGIVLTVGMAVDANVLVFERIKEELKSHSSLKVALESGYDKAFSAIIDSNLTTILAALVLMNFDSGPVKGFAITLIIGVASSMFTALFMTRFFFRAWLGEGKNKTLNMMNLIRAEKLNFVKYSKMAFLTLGLTTVLGIYFSAVQKQSVLGMDFTGGYATNVSLLSDETSNIKPILEGIFEKSGLGRQDYSIRQSSENNQFKIFLSKNFDTKLNSDSQSKVNDIYQLLKNGNLKLSSTALSEMEKSWTQISGQMSETMRNQALMGIGLALLGILVYISFRFELKYALASTLGLGSVILATLSIIVILNALGLPLQIDLNIVAAILTIVGYSLNDTIIVFDRIREECKKNPHLKIKDLADQALNTTLSRTLLTSGTTLIVLLALVFLGGASIFSFSLVMALGVFIGTLSTFYIATPLLLYFEKKDKKEKKILSFIN